jgi:hypothetical protein
LVSQNHNYSNNDEHFGYSNFFWDKVIFRQMRRQQWQQQTGQARRSEASKDLGNNINQAFGNE